MINGGLWRFETRLAYPETAQRVAATVSADLLGSRFTDLVLMSYPDDPSQEALLSVWRNDSATPCAADVNYDGVVNSADLAMFTQQWVSEIQSGGRQFDDLNGDGVVDEADVVTFIRIWFDALSEGC